MEKLEKENKDKQEMEQKQSKAKLDELKKAAREKIEQEQGLLDAQKS